MADVRRFDLEDLAQRPGTYFNPTTEMLIVVDDGAALETGLLDEADDDAEWVLLGDEPAVDEHRRDEVIEAFETGRVGPASIDDDEEVEDEEELEPDPDEDY
jgi:hypothetical protein